MATDLFSRARAYRKKHPSVSQSEAVSILAKQDKKKPAKKSAPARKKKAAPKKKAAVGKARKHKKKAAPKKRAVKKAAASGTTKRRKIKIKVKKSGMPVFSIGAVSMSKIHTEHAHQASIHRAIKHHQAMLKNKATKQEKDHLRREIKAYRGHLAASKKHVSVLKRSI